MLGLGGLISGDPGGGAPPTTWACVKPGLPGWLTTPPLLLPWLTCRKCAYGSKPPPRFGVDGATTGDPLLLPPPPAAPRAGESGRCSECWSKDPRGAWCAGGGAGSPVLPVWWCELTKLLAWSGCDTDMEFEPCRHEVEGCVGVVMECGVFGLDPRRVCLSMIWTGVRAVSPSSTGGDVSEEGDIR